MQASHSFIPSVVAVLVVLGAMALRLRRMTRPRPLKIERLWILPAGLALIGVGVLVEVPPRPLDWLWIALAAAGGAGLGWVRGSLMTITVRPETHALDVKASPAAVLLVAALLVARQVFRFSQGGAHVGGVVLDALIVFAIGLACVQRLEMGLRARRLLLAARTLRASAA